MVRPVVAVNAIVMRGGKILLIKRNKEPFKGMWSLIGGKLEKEKLEEGMLREVKEETGLNCKIVKLSGIFNEIVDSEKAYIMFVFELEAPSFTVVECDEGELKWFDLLPNNMAPADKFMFEKKDKFSIWNFKTNNLTLETSQVFLDIKVQ